MGDRVVVIAAIAGTTQGVTASLLGSSYAVAFGMIAGLLDMIPTSEDDRRLHPRAGDPGRGGLTAASIMLAFVLIYSR